MRTLMIIFLLSLLTSCAGVKSYSGTDGGMIAFNSGYLSDSQKSVAYKEMKTKCANGYSVLFEGNVKSKNIVTMAGGIGVADTDINNFYMFNYKCQ